MVTSATDKIAEAIKLLQEDNLIDPSLSLREAYDKYLHPDNMNFEDKDIWKAIQENHVLDLFQFNSIEGAKGIKAIQPENLIELSNVNGLIRLVAPDNSDERPLDKYRRFKSNPQLWYEEMASYNLTEENMRTLEKYYGSSYGISISQENFLFSLGDEGVCGWGLSKCNDARRIISKKKIDKLPILREEIIRDAATPQLGEYYWDNIVMPISSYAFSDPHALAYAMVAYQMAFIATKWNSIYWTTACLIVNSESLDDVDSSKAADYEKIAIALGQIIQNGVKVSLIDINKSGYGFKPDAENNQILYGLKPLSHINAETVQKIMDGRPYSGIKDFMQRCPLEKRAMLNLIKAGAFDSLDTWARDRNEIMGYYIKNISGLKSKLNLQNVNGLIEKDLIPKELEYEKKVFLFNKFLSKTAKGQTYYLCGSALDFYSEHFDMEYLNYINDYGTIDKKDWKKQYDKVMDKVRTWLKDNQERILRDYNKKLFESVWEHYADGTLADWEMDSVCFYQSPHPLNRVPIDKYGIANFNTLIPNEVDYYFTRGQRNIPIYKLSRIMGTVIAKNDSKSSISLLTPNGVVTVKFNRDYYAMFKKRISEDVGDGKKKIREDGWFSRGTKLMITGYRRDDIFFAKRYKNSPGHTLYKIIETNDEGEVILTHERYGA